MAVFKCKMCGGTIEFEDGATIGVCDSCGTTQTLPRLDNDKKANLYDRANHFRRNNDFDKAMGIYEQILNEDNTDAEAYWSLVLCRYGIEYVEDAQNHKRIPTINRSQFTSIYMDEDYKAALQYADEYQKQIYEKEAKAIDDIQKGILEISSKEKPFDVFICYKETDSSGRRTQDSVLANELYHQLTQEGFKVFFSRITLEDKLGVAFEPYIFAALNSAKVMVVVGTKPEFFNAVWVKNEWSRYLALIKNGAKKILIPAYRDMDPYDLPEEFSHLQAQDMSKLGFMQDLIRGIKKNISDDTTKTMVKETIVSSITPLLERAYLFLEDGEWQNANIYCEKVLDIDPKNAEAYLGKLMAELKVNKRKNLADCEEPFVDRDNYSKVLRFGDETMEAEMRGYIKHISDRNENERKERIYDNAVHAKNAADSEKSYKSAAQMFQTIQGFKDADILIKECIDKAEICRKDELYLAANQKMADENIKSYEEAIKIFETIHEWNKADDKIHICKNKIEEIKAKEEANRLELECKAEKRRINKRKRKKLLVIASLGICGCVLLFIVMTNVVIPNIKYSTQKDGLKNVVEGDTIKFGFYEQDNNIFNGKEDIRWRVLDVEDDKALVISEYVIDCKPYNTERNDTTWAECTLRSWLNKRFLYTAFSIRHRDMIEPSEVLAEKNPDYEQTAPGIGTTDKIFLLSVAEARKYPSLLSCACTRYAESKGLYTKYGNCDWWLRTPGYSQNLATYVDAGYYSLSLIVTSGIVVDESSFGVRPAMWINIE